MTYKGDLQNGEIMRNFIQNNIALPIALILSTSTIVTGCGSSSDDELTSSQSKTELEKFTESVAGDFSYKNDDAKNNRFIEYKIKPNGSFFRTSATTHKLIVIDEGTSLKIQIDDQEQKELKGVPSDVRIPLQENQNKDELPRLDIEFNCVEGVIGKFNKYTDVSRMSEEQRVLFKGKAISNNPLISAIVTGTRQSSANYTDWKSSEDKLKAQIVSEYALKNQAAELCQVQSMQLTESVEFEWHLFKYSSKEIWFLNEIVLLEDVEQEQKVTVEEKKTPKDKSTFWCLKRK